MELTDRDEVGGVARLVWDAIDSAEELDDLLGSLIGLDRIARLRAATDHRPDRAWRGRWAELATRFVNSGRGVGTINRYQAEKASRAATELSDRLDRVPDEVILPHVGGIVTVVSPETASVHQSWPGRIRRAQRGMKAVREISAVINELRSALGDLSRARMSLDLSRIRLDAEDPGT
ncbi:MAG: hypothetical protein OEU32_10700 [Acidimicrobiia bacterium]|nr:hypothetical protein [Acidimicrobiia bacterium]